MPTQLYLYNRALQILKSTELADVTEQRPERFTLDTLYSELKEAFLETGFWKFAMREVKIEPDPDITPSFGPANAFNKPTDWKRTHEVAADEYFQVPLRDWREEANCWWSDADPIYVRYVSNDATSYGGDLSKWTGKFTEAFCQELAKRACPLITGGNKEVIEKDALNALKDARAFEALREPQKAIPEGRWSAARGSTRSRQYYTG